MPRLVLGSLMSFQGVFQDRNELLDLAVVQYTGEYTPLSGRTVQKVYPLCPFPGLGWVD
jgi:hypothetical protein